MNGLCPPEVIPTSSLISQRTSDSRNLLRELFARNGYRRRMARVITGVVLAAVFVSVLVMALMKEAQVECEVCIEFGGGRVCRTSIASDRDRAVNGATTAACVILSGGVTSGIQCGNTPPSSLRCSE